MKEDKWLYNLLLVAEKSNQKVYFGEQKSSVDEFKQCFCICKSLVFRPSVVTSGSIDPHRASYLTQTLLWFKRRTSNPRLQPLQVPVCAKQITEHHCNGIQVLSFSVKFGFDVSEMLRCNFTE